MKKKLVLWAGFRHKVLEVDENLDMAKIAKVIDGKVDHSDYWWVALSKLRWLE